MRVALGRLAAVGWRVRLPRPRWFRAAVAAAACAVAAFLFGVGVGGVAAAGPGVRQVRSVPVASRTIALTFDDGPDPTYTPAILAELERYGAKATFFVIGQELVRYPAIGRAEAEAGMEIGNHGFHHLVLAGLDPTAIRSEAQPVEREITSITGNRPTLYRLPRGRASGRALRALADLGYTTVNWSIDTRDWTGRSAQAIAAQVLAEAEPGAIVLLHDGGGNRQATVQALGIVLPALQARGYQFVTVSQLLELGQPQGATA